MNTPSFRLPVRACWLVLFCALPARAEEPPRAAPTGDAWEVAQIEGARAGYVRTTTAEVERGGRKVFRTAQELRLTVRRFREVIQLRMESGTEETADGEVVGVFMKQYEGEGVLALNGVVKDKTLHVKIEKGDLRIERRHPWNGKVLGLRSQERIFQKRKVKPGDRFSFQSFEPTINAVVTVRATVGEVEEVDVLGKKRKLLRATLASDKIEVPGASVQLPPITVWLNKELMPVRRQVEVPGLGKILLTRASREAALARAEIARVADIGLKALVPLDREINRPHATESAVYRITIEGDDDPGTALAEDERQKVKNVKGDTFELHVHAVRSPGEDAKEAAGEEFLKSCYYLDSDDKNVRRLAREAVGDETNAWRKARRIERWVRDNMRLDNTVQFAPAGEVARNLRGDCRQHAVLAAAMCRAAGVPSRTAVGLVYTEDRQGKPKFGFHMWVEVWVKGRWVALDATLGRGSIGAAHIKVADHSWHNVQSLTPLLPVTRVLGKMKIQVDRVEYR